MLVGRRLATGALRSAVDAAGGGAGGVVLLAGEAGMGKTVLASEAVTYAKTRGAAAVWGTCWEGDGAPGFWPWIQVIRALAADAGGSGEAVLAGLTGVSAERGGGLGDESAIRFRTYDLAATYLRSRAAQRPLVVVLDDLHWADVSSLRLLVFLSRQLHDAAALVIGTYRDVEVTAEDHPGRPLLAELAGQAELIRLTGLAADEVGQLIEKVCGEHPPAPLIQAVHHRTAGNPFFAQQIAQLLAAQGVPLDRAQVTGVPPAVGDVLARRLARLPGKVVDLLAVASVVGRRFPIETVAAIAGVPAEAALPLLDGAVRAAARRQALMPPEFALHLRAWLLLEAGEKAAAAALVASIPDGPTTYRWRHTAMLTSDAELAAAAGDRNRCATRYEQLLPMAGEFAVVGAAVFTTGPVALQLGLLAAALGRWDDAAAHLDDATRRCDRLGAALLAARARTELARVRTETGGDGGGNVFRRDGDTWTLAFGGRGVPVRDAKGLRDLAVLLAAPGREVAATELIAGVATATAAGLAALGADPVLDDRARAAYRTRLARLDEELAEADTHHDIERSDRLAAERDALIDELTYAAGLGGRRRRVGDVTERARTTVTARIRDAIGRIERVHPGLGRHLRASIVTGARCSYRPAATVRWSISQS